MMTAFADGLPITPLSKALMGSVPIPALPSAAIGIVVPSGNNTLSISV